MVRRALLVVVLAGLGILSGCEDDEPRPPNVTEPGNGGLGSGGGGGAGSSGDGGAPRDSGSGSGSGSGDAGDAGSACSDLTAPTNGIEQNAISDETPAGLGGTLVDATYDLIEAQKYVGIGGQAGPNGNVIREIMRISGGTTLERVRITRLNNGPEVNTNASYVLQQSGPNLTLTMKCPTQGTPESFAFTIQNGRLTLYSAGGESFAYTARP